MKSKTKWSYVQFTNIYRPTGEKGKKDKEVNTIEIMNKEWNKEFVYE